MEFTEGDELSAGWTKRIVCRDFTVHVIKGGKEIVQSEPKVRI